MCAARATSPHAEDDRDHSRDAGTGTHAPGACTGAAQQRLRHVHPGPDHPVAGRHGGVLLPLNEETLTVLQFYDNLICVIFLIDFTINITRAKPKRAYWIDRRGWLDLIGSIPTLGLFRIAALLRLARLSRLERVSRMLRGNARQALIDDVVKNRGQYAIFITLLTMMVVLTVSSVLILQFESKSPGRQHQDGR